MIALNYGWVSKPSVDSFILEQYEAENAECGFHHESFHLKGSYWRATGLGRSHWKETTHLWRIDQIFTTQGMGTQELIFY